MVSKTSLTAVLLLCLTKAQAFTVRPLTSSNPRISNPVLFASISPDAEDDDVEREYARVRRGRNSYYDEDNDDGYGYDRSKGVYSNDEISDIYDTEETYYMEDEEEDGDYDDMDDDEYGLFGNAVIPNPLLDSIDPDGAADRFSELASDPRFWIDMVIFFTLLDWLSAIGPREALGNQLPLF